MNTPESLPTPTQTPASPTPNIDAILNDFLTRAGEFISQDNPDPRAVCSLGWLVLKIKKFQVDHSAQNSPSKPGGLSDNDVRQLEQAAKIL